MSQVILFTEQTNLNISKKKVRCGNAVRAILYQLNPLTPNVRYTEHPRTKELERKQKKTERTTNKIKKIQALKD